MLTNIKEVDSESCAHLENSLTLYSNTKLIRYFKFLR